MRNFVVALRIFVTLSVLTGVLYPLGVTVIGQALFSYQAQGSLLSEKGHIVGSELIGQKFTQPKYFWSRPSAVDYGTFPSGASNASPTNEDLKKAVQARRQSGWTGEMLFTSGSGLDPHISPGAAKAQIQRIASERGLSQEKTQVVEKLIEDYTEGRQWGVLGEVRVNVLKLNLALDRIL